MPGERQPFTGERRLGSIGRILLYGVTGVWLVLSMGVIVILEGHSLIGFGWGVLTTIVMGSFLHWGATRSPSIMVAHKQATRTYQNDQHKQREHELGLQESRTVQRLVRILPMAVMIALVAGTLYFLGYAVTVAQDVHRVSELTGSSMGLGALFTAALGWWWFVLRNDDRE